MPTLRNLSVAAVLITSGCDLLGSPGDDPTTGDGCEYRVDSWWPVDADQVTHEPGALVAIPHTAGGVDADGIGLDIPAEVVWDGVVYGELPDQSTLIGMPMMPGEYAVRTQTIACPELGNDYTLTVAYPPPPATAEAPDLTGTETRGLEVAWEVARDAYAAVVFDGTDSFRIHVDADDDSVLETFACDGCWRHLRFSPDGQRMANGDHLYEWREGAWFLVTTFDSQWIEFDPSDPDRLFLSSDEGPTSVVDLETGQRTVVVAVGGLTQVAEDGWVVAAGELYDSATGKVADVSLLADMEMHHWSPDDGIVIGSTTLTNPGLLWLMQASPVEQLGSTDCAITYRNRRLAFDPLGEFVVSYGLISSDTATYNPWFQVCEIGDDLRSIGPAADMTFPFEVDAIFQRTESAAWSPDGQTLLTGGRNGVFLHRRGDVEAMFSR